MAVIKAGKLKRARILVLLTALASTLVFFAWLSFFALNTQIVHEYPSMSSLPGPNEFVSARGTFFAVFLCFFSFNVLPSFLFLTALEQRSVGEWAALHRFITGALAWLNVALLLISLFMVAFLCNNGWGALNTPCHADGFCCALFADAYVIAAGICSNAGLCSPDVTRPELAASYVYWGHVGAAFVFFWIALGQAQYNKWLVKKGILEK